MYVSAEEYDRIVRKATEGFDCFSTKASYEIAKHKEEEPEYEDTCKHCESGDCPFADDPDVDCETCEQFDPEEVEWEEPSEDPYFSWTPCAICGCDLGGNRVDLVAVETATGETVEFEGVCETCAYTVQAGTLPDDVADAGEVEI